MKVLNEITLKSLKLNKKRTIVTIIGIILSVSLITAVFGMVACFRETLLKKAIKDNGYNHIIASGNQDILNILKNNREIKKTMVVANLGYSYINSKNEYKPYLKLSSVVNPSDFLDLPFNLKKGRFPANSSEVVISNSLLTNGKVNLKIGDTINYKLGKRYACDVELDEDYLVKEVKDIDDKIICGKENLVEEKELSLKIVGIIDRPNYTFESYSSPGYTSLTVNLDSDNLITYNTLKTPKNYNKVFNSLKKSNKFKNLTLNNEVLRYEVFKFSDETYNMILTVAFVVTVIIMITSIYCIKNSFDISTIEKTKMFGHLISLGATKKQIKNIVLKEGFYLGIIGIPLGLFFGILADYILILVMKNILETTFFNATFVFKISYLAIILAIITSIITIYLSCIKSARRASKISPIEAIRNNLDIKIKNNKLIPPKIIKKIFKTPGVLAYKNLKRNKKKYKTTVISLVVSILTFITMNTFITYTFKLSGNYYQDLDYDLKIRVNDPTKENINNIINLDNIDKYNIVYEGDILNVKNSNRLTKEGINYLDNELNINILLLDDKTFTNYLKKLKITSKKDEGILIDHHAFYINNKTVIRRLTNYHKNEYIKGLIGTKEYNIKISNIENNNTFGYEDYVGMYLILNKDYYKDIDYHTSVITISSKNDQDLENDLDKLDQKLFIDNLKRNNRDSKSMLVIVSIFLYGFITVITLIGITNIFNTITTNMALRKKEFATIKSIGMTKKEFNKMINLEILFYLTKSLFYGIILGLIGSYLVYLSFASNYDAGFIIPIKSIVICSISVILLITVIMKYAIRKTDKQNIIEAIRNENI
mgnify:FL=1